MGRFSQKSEGSTAGRLLWFYQQMWYKLHIKQSTKKNTKVADHHRKNDVFKNTRSQRHEDYSGFVKSRVAKKSQTLVRSTRLLTPFGHHFRAAGRQKPSPPKYGERPCRDPAFHETIVILVPLGPSVFLNIVFRSKLTNFQFFLLFFVLCFICHFYHICW